jgi:transcription initiation factor IIE alpha subunit
MTTFGTDRYPSAGSEQTSQDAYRSLDDVRGKIRKRVYSVMLNLHDGATSEELERLTELSGNTVRPRLKELERDGFVFKSEDRRPTRSGRDAIVWKLKPRIMQRSLL